MSQDVTNYVESLRRVHDDNGTAEHFAKEPSGTTRSTMFLTAMRIGELRPFIDDVRCNIFHGRKSFAEADGKNQKKRIEVYFLFLKGLATLFFGVFKGFPACRDRRRI